MNGRVDQFVTGFEDAIGAVTLKEGGATFRVDVTGVFVWDAQWAPTEGLAVHIKPHPQGFLLIASVVSYSHAVHGKTM